jgi:hypothetical protein
MLHLVERDLALQPEHLAVVTTKYWGSAGVRLSVSFLDSPPADLRARILSHMNAWSQTANVQFTESNTDGQVRIARISGGQDGGFWSNLGTDILHVSPDRPTMNLEGFTMNTAESEFHRVVRHETGHTLGFPHEHLRRELVEKIVPEKAYAYFLRTQGWDQTMVDQQVLTPIEDSSLISTEHADPNSIMCYQIPGEITEDGQPIIGGTDIDQADFAFARLLYPPDVQDGGDGSQASPGAGPGRAGRAVQVQLEDFFAAASRAGLRAMQAQLSGSADKPRPRIFIGIVASEE